MLIDFASLAFFVGERGVLPCSSSNQTHWFMNHPDKPSPKHHPIQKNSAVLERPSETIVFLHAQGQLKQAVLSVGTAWLVQRCLVLWAVMLQSSRHQRRQSGECWREPTTQRQGNILSARPGQDGCICSSPTRHTRLGVLVC